MRFPLRRALLVVSPVVMFFACQESPPFTGSPGSSDDSDRLLEVNTLTNRSLEIGPVEGLTTAWHKAPHATAIPVGTVVTLRQPGPPGATMIWSGAVEVLRDRRGSTAECVLDDVGQVDVSVVCRLSNGVTIQNGCTFDVIDIHVSEVTVAAVHVNTDPVVPGPDATNVETMAAFFGASVASLTELGPGHFRTSRDRAVPASGHLHPESLTPLMEWRVDGLPVNLGPRIAASRRVSVLPIHEGWYFQEAGPHVIEAGPEGPAARIDVDTYAVTITSHVSGDDYLEDGERVTFTAVTDPPGLESEITWLSSTKYGTGLPISGTGPTFEVEFNDTWGDNVQWLGVRADDTIFNQDDKMGACCLETGACKFIEGSACVAMGGHFQGVGVECADADCPSYDQRLNLVIAPASYSGCTDVDYDAGECADLTSDPVPGQAFVWVVASDIDGFETGIGAAQFGIGWDEEVGVQGWTICTGGAQIPSPTWPASGSGNIVSFAGGCYEPTGSNAKIGYFTVPDGAVDAEMRLLRDPRKDDALLIDCDAFEKALCRGHLGRVTLAEGTIPLCEEAPCSALPLGACCLPDGACDLLTSAECATAGGSYLGNDTECATIDCRAGACCLPDGSCAQLTPNACMSAGGDYQGDDTECDADACPTGACCQEDGTCTEATEIECASSGGAFQGAGTTCDEDACPTGACCLADGECVEQTADACAAAGGEYAGDGTSCDDVPCPTGACCVGSNCETLTEAGCAAASGEYQGDGVPCTATLCIPPPTGACCVGEECDELTEAECAAQGGTYLGDDTVCSFGTCAPPTGEQRINLYVTTPSYSGCSDPTFDAIDAGECTDLANPPATGAAFVWIVASDLDGFATGIGLVEWGVEYDAGVNVTGWQLCTGGSQIPQEGWPASGTGNAVTWQFGCYEPEGSNARAGFFTVSDVGVTGSMTITRDPRKTHALIVDCMATDENRLCVEALGSLTFGQTSSPVCGEVSCGAPASGGARAAWRNRLDARH